MRFEQLNPAQWKRARELAEKLLDTPQDQWESVDPACDEQTRAAALRLARSFAESPATNASRLAGWRPDSGDTAADLSAGDRIGAYKIEREAGRGGMGCVYLASRADDAFSKVVAIKVLGNQGAAARTSFQTERRIQANLEHENIARLHDAGTTPGGQPYFVMEYVDGVAVDEYCELHNLDTDGRLRLLLAILHAVAYAHQQGVLHRDLKPSNILVNAAGAPKLLDFGIAASTSVGNQVWAYSPGYASPEQRAGQSATEASDVYSAGVIMRRLLGVGARPSDLDAILAKATEEDPSRRYASAAAFAADLDRFRNGYAVEAHQAGWGYRASKHLRRHMLSAGLALALVVALIAGAAGTLWQRERVRQQLRDATSFVEKVLAEDTQMRGMAGATEVRKRLLTGALDQLKAVAPDQADDQFLSRKLSEAYLRIGVLQGLPGQQNLADHKNAALSLHQGRLLAEGIVRRWPDDVRNQRLLAEGLAYEQAVVGFLGRYQECVDLGGRVDALLPKVGKLEPIAAIAHHNLLIRCYAKLGRYDEAVRAARQWVAEEEAVKPVSDSLITASGRLARTLHEAGKKPEARVAYERTIELLREARRAAPSLTRDFALGGEILAAAVARPINCGHPDDRRNLEEARKILSAAHEADSDNRPLASMFADSQRCLAVNMAVNGQAAQALALLEENRRLLMNTKPPINARPLRLYQNWYETASALERQRKYAEAAEANALARRSLPLGEAGPNTGLILTDAWNQLAGIRKAQGRNADVVAALREQLAAIDAYAKAAPGPVSGLAQARTYKSAAERMLAAGDEVAAKETMAAGIRLFEKLPSAPQEELAAARQFHATH